MAFAGQLLQLEFDQLLQERQRLNEQHDQLQLSRDGIRRRLHQLVEEVESLQSQDSRLENMIQWNESEMDLVNKRKQSVEQEMGRQETQNMERILKQAQEHMRFASPRLSTPMSSPTGMAHSRGFETSNSFPTSACQFGSTSVHFTSNASGHYPLPSFAAPTDGIWYKWNTQQGNWTCCLCKKVAEEGHLRSAIHHKRVQYPDYYLEVSGLQPDLTKHWDALQGRHFLFDSRTGHSTWECPATLQQQMVHCSQPHEPCGGQPLPGPQQILDAEDAQSSECTQSVASSEPLPPPPDPWPANVLAQPPPPPREEAPPSPSKAPTSVTISRPAFGPPSLPPETAARSASGQVAEARQDDQVGPEQDF